MPCRINQSTASYLRSLRWGFGAWVTVLACAATVVVTQAHAATTPPAEEKTTLTPEWQAVAQAVTQWGAQAYPDAPAILLSDQQPCTAECLHERLGGGHPVRTIQ